MYDPPTVIEHSSFGASLLGLGGSLFFLLDIGF
jgi:hypothetical protein